MRPLKLCLENFTCFRGRPVELDFEPLDLFAIAGPTGAGKSSLLDGIIFALYGRVPRIDGRRVRDLISLGADRMSVVLDFRVGTETYRVTRLVRSRGTGTAQLEQLGADGEARPLGAGVRDVDDEIAAIVGLSYETFTQAVVLPQGEFQKFLKSRPGERREILTRILRLQIYDRMRDLGARRRDLLLQAVEQGERRLTEDYAHATPEKLLELTARANALGAEIEAVVGQLREAETRRDALRAAREKTRELEQRRVRLLQVDADEPKILGFEARLEAARRAVPVLPLIKAAQTAVARAAEAERAHDAAAKQHRRLVSEREEAKHRLERAANEAEEIPGLAQRIAALDQVIGRMRPRPGLVKSLGEAEGQHGKTASKLQEARAKNQKAQSELATASRRLREAADAVTAVRFDATLFEALDAKREEANGIANLRNEVSKRAAEARLATGQLQEKEAAQVSADAAADTAEKEWNHALQRVQEIDQERGEARHRAAAAVLRRELHLGEPCPVCAQPIAELPPALASPALDALQHKFEKAQKAEGTARSRWDSARTVATGAKVASKAARDAVEQSAEHCRRATAGLEKACQALADRMRDFIPIAEDKAVEQQVQQAWSLTAAERKRDEAARTEHVEAERDAQRREQAAQGFAATIVQLSDRLTQQEQTVTLIRQQIAEIDREVCQVTRARDPAVERLAVFRRRDELEKVLRESRDADHSTESALSAAAARLEASQLAWQTAQRDVQQHNEAARIAAAAAGFRDEAAVAEAELDPGGQERISTQIQVHRDERRRIESRIGELVGELGGKEVAQDVLEAAENVVKALRDHLSEAQSERARIGEQVRFLTDAIARADELRNALEKQRAEHAVYHGLALDLRSDRFQAFLLEETFRALVSGASTRLWDLTKRYRFDWQNESFQVVDHDNARQTRSADTLSGGETFLASLALALQLSEQVQHAAGATTLDSLFIDEGFGTLDPEALDMAASAIESLQVGGRMVGIITHIEELSSRLPQRLKVEKANTGSRVAVETA
jgi:exonuclease SbcC